MKYKLTSVYGVFNAGTWQDEVVFDTMDELTDAYQETINRMGAEEAELFDYDSRIETIKCEESCDDYCLYCSECI